MPDFSAWDDAEANSELVETLIVAKSPCPCNEKMNELLAKETTVADPRGENETND
jgi:hypothetical protein